MRTHHAPSLSAARIALAAASALALTACGGGSPSDPPAATPADFQAEARKSIDEKNMSAELERLKREVEADSK
jgi:predicted small lipoprotein YifL